MTKARWTGARAVALTAVAGLGLVGAAGLATAGAGARRPDGEARIRRTAAIAEYLGLTAEQKAQWHALREKQHEQTEPLRDEGRDLRRKLRAALDAQTPDATAVGEAVLAVKAHREKARAQREAFEQQLRALLSPEQQQKLDAMKAARRRFGRGRGERLGGPGMRESRPDPAPASPRSPVEG